MELGSLDSSRKVTSIREKISQIKFIHAFVFFEKKNRVGIQTRPCCCAGRLAVSYFPWSLPLGPDESTTACNRNCLLESLSLLAFFSSTYCSYDANRGIEYNEPSLQAIILIERCRHGCDDDEHGTCRECYAHTCMQRMACVYNYN